MIVESAHPEWPQIKAAKVLAVGAGGIGCELLKTLALSGFENVQVVDMDSIETSNLNRQFLFRKRHIGLSKAKVAAEAIRRFRPRCNILAMQANIKEPEYNVSWFKGFDLVLNGLDNLDARRHVNRLCLAAGVPLVESGTAAFLGQVTVHIKDKYECFECQPKAEEKQPASCTIRTTPDKPIHCVAWARDLLFPRLFGRADDITDLDEVDASPEQEGSFFIRQQGEGSAAYAERVFHRVFRFHIEGAISMTALWKTRKPPKPLKLEELFPAACTSAQTNGMQQANDSAEGIVEVSACRPLGLWDPHKLWSTVQSATVFLRAIQLFLDIRSDEVGAAVFDKDDALAVEFVAAASNLRSACYSIPTLSLFCIKGIAGKIIHAIATTNAIVSGLIVAEATKLLAGMPEACRATHLRSSVHTGRSGRERIIGPSMLEPPNPKCPVCSSAPLALHIDTSKTCFKDFLDKVVRKKVAITQPAVMCGGFMYEEGPGLDDDEVVDYAKHLPKLLSALPGGGIKDSSVIEVSDQAQQLSLSIIVTQQDVWDEEKDPEGFRLGGPAPPAQKDAPIADSAAAGPSWSAAETDDMEGFEIVEEPLILTDPSLVSKRKRTDDPQPTPGKRLKEAEADDDSTLID